VGGETVKLAIGIPCLDFVPTPHYAALLKLAQDRAYDPKRKKEIQLVGTMIVQSNIIPDARRSLVEQAIAIGASHLWFLDSDVVPTEGVLNTLISHRKDIVAATYRSRYPPHEPLGNRDLSVSPERGLLPMANFGLGCCLIDLAIFPLLALPWFAYEFGKIPGRTRDISEDSWFCKQARAAGITLWMDSTLMVGHCGQEIY